MALLTVHMGMSMGMSFMGMSEQLCFAPACRLRRFMRGLTCLCPVSARSIFLPVTGTAHLPSLGINKIHFVLFGRQTWTIGPYLTAIHRIIFPVILVRQQAVRLFCYLDDIVLHRLFEEMPGCHCATLLP
jgi:hypothetical protein